MRAVTVRQAVIQDVPRVVPVFDAYRVHFGQRPNPALAQRFLFDRFEHRDSVLFIAEDDKEVRGIAHLYPSFSSLGLRRIWILNDFFIEAAHRGEGIGKRLFAAVSAFASLTGAKGIELTVEHTNVDGWRFWEGLGFQLDDAFRHYLLAL